MISLDCMCEMDSTTYLFGNMRVFEMRVDSAKILAFEFAEEEDVESYVDTLEERTELQSMYDGDALGPMGVSAQSFDNLGIIDGGENSFETLYVSIVRFGSVPDAAALMLRGPVSEYSSETENVLESQNLQNEIREIWTNHFDDFPSGSYSDSPETLISGQIVVDDLDEAFQLPDDVSELSNHQPFVESIRNESFCRSLGVEYRGLMSVEVYRDEYLILTAQTVWTSSGDQVQHGRYAIIEFLPEGSGLLSVPEPENVAVPPMGFSMSARRAQQMIAPLFYYYWLQGQSRHQKQELRNELREIPRTIEDGDDLSSVIESVQAGRTVFYDAYTRFLDRVDSAEDMLERVDSAAARDSGIPLLSTQTPFVRSEIEGVSYDFDYESGILELLIADVRSNLENAKRQYEILRDRYEIVFKEMDQQFDLEIARKNKDLSESSIALQKEMKDLNESSFVLQEKVSSLNWWVTILTIVLVAKEVGSVLGFW